MTEIARVLAHIPDSTAPLHAVLAPQHAAAIDWSRGLELWGSPERLQGALERFLNDHQSAPALLQRDLAQADWTPLAQHAHRLRGAAGNLTLRQVHALAERAENAALAQDAAAASEAISALPAALDAVRHALAAPTDNAATDAAAAVLPTLNAQQQQDTLEALTQLSSAMAQGEWPEAPLHALEQNLPAPVLQQLQQAIDRFDFSQAQHCLDDLRAQLLVQTPVPTMTPAL